MLENSYALFFVSSYFLGTCVFIIKAFSAGRRASEIAEVVVIILISSLFGAKLFHALFEAEGHALPTGEVADNALELFMADPWHWARLFDPGYVFYGGLVSALIVGGALLYKRGFERPLQYADFVAPALALGLGLGRIGCYAAGCCFSQEIPIQLIESAFAFSCCAWLLMRNTNGDADGFQLWLFVSLYAVFRFCVEFIRDDYDRGIWLWGYLSTSQIVSLLLLLGCIFYDQGPAHNRRKRSRA